MTRRFRYYLVGIMALVACFCTISAQAGTLNGRFHSQMPATHYVTKGVDIFINELKEKTGGAVSFTHFPAQQLFRDKEIIDVLPKGGIEGAQINSAMFVGKMPEAGILMMPATFKDLNHYYRFLYDHSKSGSLEYVDKAFAEKANIVNLGTLLYAPNTAALTNKPVTMAKDYRGMKIRGPGKIFAVNLQAWGASGVVMSSSDVYMALERGTIDGVFSGVSSFWSRKWYESAKYMSVVDGLMPLTFSLCINLDFWNKMTVEQKKAAVKAAEKAELYCLDAAVKVWAEAEKSLKDAGVNIHYFNEKEADKLRNLARPVIAKHLVEKPLGKQQAANVAQWVKATEAGDMTAEQAIRMKTQKLLVSLE